MIPAMRAAADRLTWEGALLAYIASLLPAKVQERPIKATGRTIRQAYADLLASDAAHNADLAAAIGRPAPAAPPHDGTLAELVQRLAAARRARYLLFDLVGELEAPNLLAIIEDRSGAYAECAFTVIEALPEIEAEPLVVNWLALVDVEGDGRPHLAARKAAYISRVREQLQVEQQG